MWYLYAGCILLGWFIGLIMFAGALSSMVFGTIKVDDGNSLYLEMDRNPKKIKERKYIVFKVKMVELPPHE